MRRRRNDNLDAIIYIFAIFLAIGVVGTIIEYIIPIIITCAIVGTILGITAIIKRYKIAKINNKRKGE